MSQIREVYFGGCPKRRAVDRGGQFEQGGKPAAVVQSASYKSMDDCECSVVRQGAGNNPQLANWSYQGPDVCVEKNQAIGQK